MTKAKKYLYKQLMELGVVIRKEINLNGLSKGFFRGCVEAYSLLKDYDYSDRYKIIEMLCTGEDVGDLL